MLIYEVGQKSTLKQIGGKAYNLAHLSSTSVEVPAWFALTSSCFNDFIYDHRDEYIKLLNKYSEENRKKIIKLIEKTEFSEEAKSKILKTIKKTFAKEDLLSIRSSATDEDGKNHSFAGMLESYLYIKQNDDIFSYIKKCYISCFSERAMKYREENGLINPKISIAVIIQKMIHPDYAGVMFTTNPQTNNTDETLISVVKGVGEKLVSGEENSTDFVVNNIGEIVVKDERGKVSLGDEILIKLQEAGQIVEKSYKPRLSQDIEFAIKDGKIYILQARPITNYSHIDKNKFRTILDNSNIIESYSGVTTPLTFTFAREVYGKIYNQTLHQFYVPEDAIKSIKKDLETMLYFYDNKVYYRLNGWYKMTSLYPGYEKNKKYMENMMGVKTPLEESKSQAKTRLVKIYARFLHKMIHMKSASSKFIAKFNRITKPYYNNKFPGYTNEQLLEVYNNLESEILDDFVTPIANDMGTMVIYGMLTDQAKKAKIHNYEGLLSNILAKQGNVESARQSKDLIAIVKEIKRDNTLYDLFTETSIEDLKAHLRGDSLLIFSKINDYIYKYGARTMGELKLETITMQQDPSF
ncbi:MAG: PEP/pyruvate-binding domain-containing protein, partial [Candidatus Saccharibacteria bacterium]|nr:PEP/pyruvate-binding domain-containing protein [Candidatus Saccharibacteria bacterium]